MVKLKRSLNTFQVTMYGIGTILGAGIYALIGKISATAGMMAPLSFIVSAILASMTAYSYTQLVKLFPKSAGEAEYIFQGFHSVLLSNIVGWLVAFTGVVSASTLIKGFVGYFQTFIHWTDFSVVFLIIILVTALAIKGIKESINIVIFFTIIEIVGLILICGSAWQDLSANEFMLPALLQNFSWSQFPMIISGAFLAFYAYIGFEDMVNLAEETNLPGPTISRSIYIAVLVSTILYVFVALVAIASIPLDELNQSKAPLKDMYVHHGGNALVISAIGIFAIFNGIIAQVIMASRILYGLRHPLKWMNFLSVINKKTQTPINATIVVAIIISLLVSLFPIKTLAASTSFIILIVFTFINLSLVSYRIKNREIQFRYLTIPIIASISNIVFLAFTALY
ncbi:APC family permease [Halobacteriovorax sp. BALOs_7]|uniref:APC family permease n=1 Tax=Halobacteriovorax sp. BALOs_7 TaxID=2109558 RepID=UPI000EA0C529|nr:amino acid permease [Halobacteriovorax sp. BALOs_7]